MMEQADRRYGGSAVTTRKKLLVILLALVLGALALPFLMSLAQANDREALEGPQFGELMDLAGIGDWIRGRFSEEEIASLPPEELHVESHFCSCEDAHYPYPVVLFNTPKGDLVARAEVQEHSAKFTPLAVRNGDKYCEVESEGTCYGSFSHPCEFTDFRFGEYLENFFPSCK